MDFTVSSAEMGLVAQETEVSSKAQRRRFTGKYKRRILKEAGTDSERVALQSFLRDVTRLRFALPGDPGRRRLRWTLK